jgi:alkaline phosphatase
MLIEEDDIDNWAHRVMNIAAEKENVADALVRYNRMAGYAIAFATAHPGTAVIMTGDHETGGVTDDFRFTNLNHTRADIPVFAFGKGTEYFHDTTVENTDIPKWFASTALGIDDFGTVAIQAA